MFDQLAKRSNRLWVYATGRFAEERCSFLCYLSSRGHSRLTLQNVNRLLLVIAERVNVRQRKPITERQIARAAKDWVEKSCAPSSTTETREIQTRRFVSVATNWFRFLGKWRDPERNPQFKQELNSPSHVRDRAIVLLLAVYGLRIGEVCRLTLDDLDWVNEKIRVRRLKNKRSQEFPLTAEVGNAILKYLRNVRPQDAGRVVFLRLRTPHRPMTTHGASCCISVHVRALGCRLPHSGPHSLRHACATHLLDEGFSLKEIGDHLGHRSPRSTQIYAKVERNKLVQVATPQLSSLKEYLRAQTQSITADWAKERLRSLQEISNFGLGGLQ
jgi:integrase